MQSIPVFNIEPSTRWPSIGLRELWDYRELLYFLTWRDIKVRYKQTVLGAIWVIIQPLFMMVVFSVFFGRLAGVKSDGLPYPVFTFCALLPWQLFSHALTESSNSLVGNQNLITKVYFPRLLIPVAAVVSGLETGVVGSPRQESRTARHAIGIVDNAVARLICRLPRTWPAGDRG